MVDYVGKVSISKTKDFVSLRSEIRGEMFMKIFKKIKVNREDLTAIENMKKKIAI